MWNSHFHPSSWRNAGPRVVSPKRRCNRHDASPCRAPGRRSALKIQSQVRVQHALKRFLVQVLNDENQARATVVAWPFIDLGGRMEHVLDRVDDDGLVIDLGDIDQALDAQDIGAVGLRYHVERAGDLAPFQGLVEIKREAVDVIVMPAPGPRGLRSFLKKNVAALVLQHAPCHVLFVKQEPHK